MTEDEFREEKFRQQLLDRLSNHTNIEIRFVKEQQFRTVYYSLLLFAAIIGVFQLPVLEKPCQALKVVAIVVVVFIAIVSIVFQRHHSKALSEYREELENSENKVLRYSERKIKRCEKRINRKKNILQEEKRRRIEKVNKKETIQEQKARRNLWYVCPLIALTIFGAVVAGFVLWFDK